MKISYSWIKDFVPLSATPAEVAEVLPMLGLEVESVETHGLPPMENLVVGEILSREPHPDADRLGVCQVKTSLHEEPRQIVCGASNYKVGDRVPVALPGCRLPGDFKIKKSKLRGVESHGMMCSAKELGLGGDHAGLMILNDRPEIGTPLNVVFPDNDTVFEIELTANRGDCLGHIGVARDLAAYYGLPLTLPEVCAAGDRGESLINALHVESDNCPYYRAWSIRGVTVGDSPDWLKSRLERVGLRPINNVVDVTNYILMETGQPLHAFDAAKIRGGRLVVRQARTGEKLVTLDEKERILDERALVIADAERALVIAGVMGSEDAEVDAGTRDVVLESAWFRPASVRGTSRRLNLVTDSAHRFARDVDPAGVECWGLRALAMIQEVAGGEVSGPCQVHGAPPRGARDIALSGNYVRQVCGYETTDAEIAQVYVRLGFGVRDAGDQPGEWLVTVPSFRPEVDRPIDLVEEFVRISGTSGISERPVTATGMHRADAPLAVWEGAVQDLLAARGFSECCHYSLTDGKCLSRWAGEDQERALALANPLTSEMSHLRASLLPGLLDALRLNQARGNAMQAFFETGRVFRTDGSGAVSELASAAFLMAVDQPRRSWRNPEAPDFYTARDVADHLLTLLPGVTVAWHRLEDEPMWQSGHAARLSEASNGLEASVGLLATEMTKVWDLDGLVLAGELVFPATLLESCANAAPVAFRSFSDFPAAERDLALIVPIATPAEEVRLALEAVAREACAGKFDLEETAIFDLYQGKGLPEGSKSLAFSLRFRSSERTLQDKEVAEVFDQVQTGIQSRGYAIR